VIPLRSRTQVGWSFGEFCCRNFTPLILDRIGNLTYRITVLMLVVSTVRYNGLETIETDRN
jgi:hypothetical protein